MNGKIGTYTKVPLSTAADLQKYYTPGVAEECKRIHADPSTAGLCTNIYNRVLVVSDGTATLGLGDIGHLASKPVMEGKVALMGRLAGIDGVDLVCAPQDIEQLVTAVACNFGAINIEDVAAPRCFALTDTLSARLDVPVFHDDQDGTAVVACASIKRALQMTGRQLGGCRIVIAGAGAGAQATARLLIAAGAVREQIFMFDSQGLLTTDRVLDKHKMYFAQSCPPMDYTGALRGADIFIGLSVAGILRPECACEMAPRPILLALANPVPEVDVDEVVRLRPDALVGTGRSGDLNQINNLMCFPFLLRGLLDARATRVTQEMLLAFADALAGLGGEGLLPSPFDWRLLFVLAPEVARVATALGVARNPITDLDRYRWRLLFGLLGIDSSPPTQAFPTLLPAPASTQGLKMLVIYTYVRYGPPQRRWVGGADAQAQLAKLAGTDYIVYGSDDGSHWRVVGGSNLGLLTAGVYGNEVSSPSKQS